MKDLLRTLFQKQADGIIASMKPLVERTDEEANKRFEQLYKAGMSLNFTALYMFDIELD